MDKKQIISKLRDDEHYYGEFGRGFLSKSDVSTLIKNPAAFKSQSVSTKEMVEGSFLHALILEPHKIGDFVIVDASTRTTNKYKEASEERGGQILLLKSEADEMMLCYEALMRIPEFVDDVVTNKSAYEEPGIAEIMGTLWKGKLDVKTSIDDYDIDIKTTSDITKFKWSARDYDYDAQSFIYREIFGKPLKFWTVDKKTKFVGAFYSSEQFIEFGKEKVLRAIENYNKFFAFGAEEDVNKFYLTEVL